VTLATPNSTFTLGGTNPVTTSGTINADLNLGHINNWTVDQEFSGNVGIGTTKTTTSALTVMDGNVGIGTWVPLDALDVNGGMNAKYRIGTTASSTTPSIPVGVGGDDIYYITALSGAITTVTFTGTPYDGEEIQLIVTDNGTARAITLGAGSTIVATTVAAPTTTVISTPLLMEFRYQASNTTWYLIGTV
jgi:hypothetical protein